MAPKKDGAKPKPKPKLSKEEAELKAKQEEEARQLARAKQEEEDRVKREEDERRRKEHEERCTLERQRLAEYLRADERPRLLAMLRKATLSHDDVAQEITLNLLLRNFVHFRLYQQADQLIANTRDPKEVHQRPFRSNNQAARYFFYLGRIRAVQASYDEAHDYLQQAFRKAPDKAVGFKTIVTKFSVVVNLLMGEIPPRSTFRGDLDGTLRPYLQLTSAVRFGQVALYNEALSAHRATFLADGTLTLIQRIRQNVIKAGLRRVMHAYTKLHLHDVCAKLDVDPADAEYVVAKAIRDGVIDATIDHEKKTITSNAVADVYSTPEPAAVFARRIHFLTQTHSQALMAMRYMPADSQEDDALDSREKRKEEELALEHALSEEDDMDML